MRASYRFLNQFLELPKNPQSVIDILTRQGFEVEQQTHWGQGLETVVVGRIQEVAPHPSSQKLQVCQVDVGVGVLRQIVCGAPNARAGLWVAVALPGTTLASKNLTIQPTTIRGIESAGMLCARDELGLLTNTETDGSGIWEIVEPAQGGNPNLSAIDLGQSVFDALGLTDTLLEISVTPNRPDVLSHQGLAREIAVGLHFQGQPVLWRDFSFVKSTPLFDVTTFKTQIANNSSVKKDSLHFSAESPIGISAFFCVVEGVDIAPSPPWLRNQLEALGQKSVNNLVDATNCILLAFGQPSHGFDLDQIAGSTLTLRQAQRDEPFTGLDGKTYILHPDDQVVADSRQVQALLGVLGGDHSKVSTATTRVALEFANPNPVALRRTARRQGRQTDASHLFEKGVDATARFLAAQELVHLLKQLMPHLTYVGACGTYYAATNACAVDFGPAPREIIFHRQKAQEKILGVCLVNPEQEMQILTHLGFHMKTQSPGVATVTIPHWRHKDVQYEADLVEECARVAGMDGIPAQALTLPNVVPNDDAQFQALNQVAHMCVSLGYHEVLSFHFMRRDDAQRLRLNHPDDLGIAVELLNPLAQDEPLLHTTLIPGLLRKVAKNIAHGLKRGQLFEQGRTFQLHEKVTQPHEYSSCWSYPYSQHQDPQRPAEVPRIAGICFGLREEKHWANTQPLHWTLHDVVSHVLALGETLGFSLEYRLLPEHHPLTKTLHPGRRVAFFAKVQDEIPLGWAGAFHPQVLKQFEISESCFGFELNLSYPLQNRHKRSEKPQAHLPSHRFPLLERDLALVVPESFPVGHLVEVLETQLKALLCEPTALGQLLEISVFDVYQNVALKNQFQKSVGLRFVIEPQNNTYTDAQIHIFMNAATACLKQCGAELRSST